MRVAYLSDVEGRWDKVAAFAAENPIVSLGAGDRLEVAPGGAFVFGGDAVDRGPGGRRVLAALVAVKRRQPEQVVLLSGNRDLNKLRLAAELRGWPPPGAPEGVTRAELLRWIMSRTMGAAQAFDHRKAELCAPHDEAVASSFLEDVAAGGLLRDYLLAAQLAWRQGATLYVHGAVSDESLGALPDERGEVGEASLTLDAWIAGLNAFHARQLAAFVEHPTGDPDAGGWGGVVRYQAPVPGTRLNQGSVVYGRPADDNNHPLLPSAAVRARLAAEGVRRVVVGHTPSGDCPSVLRDGAGFELILADNSYGRLETGSQLHLADDHIEVRGETQLDDGGHHPVRFALALDDLASPIGRHQGAHLVKGRLADGRLLLYRGLPERRVEQLAVEG